MNSLCAQCKISKCAECVTTDWQVDVVHTSDGATVHAHVQYMVLICHHTYMLCTCTLFYNTVIFSVGFEYLTLHYIIDVNKRESSIGN